MKGFFKEKNTAVSFFSYAVITLTVLLGAFYGILNRMFFEEKIYMYSNGSEGALAAYYTALAVTAAVITVFCAVCKRKKTDLTAVISVVRGETENTAAKVIRLAGGAIFAVGAIMRLIRFFTEKASSPLPAAVTVLCLLLFVCLSVYFFPEADKKLGLGGFTAFCGILGAVAFIIDTLATYADMSIPIASEYRILTAASTVLFLLALVSEIRIKVAEPKPCSYLALTAIASTVGGSVSIGRMISLLGGKTVSGSEIARTVCGIGITVYFTSRLLSLVLARNYLEDRGGIPYETEPPITENKSNEQEKDAE